jgi:hypothetical protein
MKTALPLLMLMLSLHVGVAATPSGLSQLSASSSGLTFEAKLVSNGGASKVDRGAAPPPGGFTAQYEIARSTETRASKMTVEMRARNMGTVPADAHFDWFFYARDLQSKTQYIWDRGQRDLSLAPGAEQKEMLASTELFQSTTKRTQSVPQQNTFGQTTGYTLQGSAQSSGARPYGWVVRLWSGDRLLMVRASSNDLETIARNITLLPKLQDPKP